jgi:hypothetical protein
MLTIKEIREKIMNRGRRMQKLDISLPDLEDLNGQLAVQELTAKDLEESQNRSKGKDGETQQILMTAFMITKSLVSYQTKERIFSDDDAGFIAEHLGLTTLMPLSTEIQKINNISSDGLEQAKKNLLKTKDSEQATS